jgi:hypothetical protein
MATEVIKCTCKGTQASEHQDKIYGSYMRVVNADQKGNIGTYTVCGG